MNPSDANELLKQPFVKDVSITIKEMIHRSIGVIGENITIGNFKRFEI